MALLELINLRKANKAILYLLSIIVALWLQTMVFSRMELLGAKPFFLPVIVVAIGLFEGGVWGGVLGLAAGIGCMLNMAGSPVLFLVLLPAFGFLSGLLADFLINRRFVSYLLLAAMAEPSSPRPMTIQMRPTRMMPHTTARVILTKSFIA